MTYVVGANGATTYMQSGAPSLPGSPLSDGDLWIDIDNGNVIWRWDGTLLQWIPAQLGQGSFTADAINALTLTAGSISAGVISASLLTNSDASGCDIVIDNTGGTILVYAISGQTTTTLSTPGAGVFVGPVGVTQAKVENWAPGGGGQGSYANGGIVGTGAGGSGGEYSCNPNYPLIPGNNYNYNVGTGGAGGTGSTTSSLSTIGADGNNTTFDGTGVVAHGGHGGFGGYSIPGGSGSTDPVHFNGGHNGLSSYAQAGNGGGGSAGSNHVGNPGSQAPSDNVAGNGGAAVLNGGAGGNGGATNSNGVAGSVPGGGGGGAGGLRPNTVKNGGAGGNGQIKITYGGTITLIASISGTAGTDAYGNTYPAGFRTNISPTVGLSGGYYEERSYGATACATGTPTTLVAATLVKLISDYGSAYNTSTGAWTCPVDGVYDIQAGASIPAFGATFEGHGTLDFTTAAAAGGTFYRRSSQSVNVNEAYENFAVFTRYFTAGEVLYVSFTQSSTGPRTTLTSRNNVVTFIRRG